MLLLEARVMESMEINLMRKAEVGVLQNKSRTFILFFIYIEVCDPMMYFSQFMNRRNSNSRQRQVVFKRDM